jgi:hypothetical protein
MVLRTFLLGIAFGLMIEGVDAAHADPIAENRAVSDTIHTAQMEPLLVIGHQINETYTGTLATAGKGGGALLHSTNGGGHAAEADTGDAAPNGIAVGGLVADETFSVVGARFSRAFHDLWSPPEEAANANYTVRIQENPVPRFGAQLLVDIQGTTLYQGYLRPNRQQIEQAARTAVKRAALYLKKYYEPREVY